MNAFIQVFFLIGLLFSSIAAISQEITASFDCKLASADIEKMICTDRDLANLDKELAQRYKEFLQSVPDAYKTTARNIQRKWLKQRLDNCNPNYYEHCLSEKYKAWLTNVNGGVLHVMELLELNYVKDPHQPELNWSVSYMHDSTSTIKDALTYRLLLDEGEKSTLIAEGVQREYVWDIPVAMHFYLTKSGGFYRGYQRNAGSDKRFCSRKTSSNVHFLTATRPFTDIGHVTLLEGDFECDGGVSQVYRLADGKHGVLNIFFKQEKDFYYHYLFSNMTLSTVNMHTHQVITTDYVDASTASFIGVPYKDIFGEFITENERLHSEDMTGTEDNCPLNGYEAFNYIGLKVHLESYGIGFKQLQYISNNVLSAKDVASVKRYKPLIDVALQYLDKVREHEEWQAKLHQAAKAFPNVIFKEGYEYEFDFPHDRDPFVEAGFYTDNHCYAKARSPMIGASFEEWIYLFWNRRVMDGTLESTENILRKTQSLLH